MINYYLLTKPGIILGNLITLAAGFFLASKGSVDMILFIYTFAGLAFIMASGCVFNNYIDRETDKKMKRTQNRALVVGLISENNAICFAIFLGVIGNLILLASTNLLTVFIADLGFVVYVFLYSLWKSRTVYGTAIGSIAGAIPPIVGYCAVSNELDAGALILFIMMVLWQMPHFFSIALLNLDDYAKAEIPVLPIKKGIGRTKIHMALYILGFIIAAAMLTFFDYTGYIYLAVAVGTGLIWLGYGLQGFTNHNDQIWGRSMFRLSLLSIMAICFAIPFDTM